jgi:hypothetical protein
MDVNAEDALLFVSDKIFEKTQQRLPEIFVEIFRGSWNRKGYGDISLNVDRS